MAWDINRATEWFEKQPWLVGCNFIPSTAINQLEMFQEDTFDKETIEHEIGIAGDLGFNRLRIYLHDLLWNDRDSLKHHLNIVLNVCASQRIKLFWFCLMIVIALIQNLGFNQSQCEEYTILVGNRVQGSYPGLLIVHEIFDKTLKKKNSKRFKISFKR